MAVIGLLGNSTSLGRQQIRQTKVVARWASRFLLVAIHSDLIYAAALLGKGVCSVCVFQGFRRGAVYTLGALLAASALPAQNSPELAAAKALDRRIEKVNDLPEAQRSEAIRELVRQVRAQPEQFRLALADNLAISAAEALGPEVLQEVADTLADALRESPKSGASFEFDHLAEFARYDRVRVSLEDPRYAAALAKLEDKDKRRGQAGFSLTDLAGKRWSLKDLTGKVVLVNFWATWCPPCVRELPDLDAVYRRFESRGFVILAITSEDTAPVKAFLATNNVTYPALLDPGDKAKKEFLVDGIPKSFLFRPRWTACYRDHRPPHCTATAGYAVAGRSAVTAAAYTRSIATASLSSIGGTSTSSKPSAVL